MSEKGQMTFGSGVQKYDAKAMDSVVNNSEYLPRLQLLTTASDVVKADLSLANKYAIIGDSQTVLGTEIEVFVGVYRPKALDMSGEKPVTSFDQESELFKDIQKRSFEQDSGCMYGPEFLVWIPEAKKYATWFLSTKSHRKLYPEVQALYQHAAHLGSKLVKTPKYSWQVSTVAPSTKKFGENDFPDADKTTEVVDKFNDDNGTPVEELAKAGSRD